MPNIKVNSNLKQATAVLMLLISTVMISSKTFGEPKPGLYIDVYGTDKISSSIVMHDYESEIQEIYKLMVSSNIAPESKDMKRIESLSRKIAEGTHKLGDFVYFKPELNKEYGNKDVYLNFDVVEKKDAKRLEGFLPKQTKSFADPDNLLTLWESYWQTGLMKAISGDTKKLKFVSCPMVYCTYGFNAPEFKKYKNIFSTLVPKNKDKLIEILREDKDPEKRANAASLLGNTKDANELIKILLPAMKDSDPKVRSKVMTILGFTLDKVRTADFPVQNAIEALDYPALADRNQALLLLTFAATQPRYVNYIKEHAKDQLMIELKMNNESVHTQAYEVLKSMAGSKFGDRDYQSWENWLNAKTSS